VTVGDGFVIKGYGGKSDLQVHLVGAVKTIDLEQGRLTLEKLDAPLYKGKAPKGAGAGSFFDTLVAVTRPDIIELLFGNPQDSQTSDESLPDDGPSLPLNLILYGPPGTGKTYRLLSEYQPRFGAGGRADQRRYDFVTFHQAYAYEDFVEGIRPVLDGAELRYELAPGVFMRACDQAVKLAGFEGGVQAFCELPEEERDNYELAKAPRFALFIDEINRGNVARILGELITLLEEDKRLGADNELILRLPASKRLFGVPPNLHIIGTMNTADRSVEALDVALRRRFAFQELAPQPQLLDFEFEGAIRANALLRTINDRLEVLKGRDYLIGHATLLAASEDPTLHRLKEIFKRAVIPLLQEYFFGDWGRIGLVLGADFVKRKDASKTRLASFAHEDVDVLAERPVYELADVDALTSVSFRKIYEDGASDA
jgi:5-methylcytosine-specific restriction protein B